MNLKAIAGFLCGIGLVTLYNLNTSVVEPSVKIGAGIMVALCGFTAFGLVVYDYRHPKLEEGETK